MEKINKRLKADIGENKGEFPVCPECNGSGRIWLARHWYSVGYQRICTYCDGEGVLTWKKEKN